MKNYFLFAMGITIFSFNSTARACDTCNSCETQEPSFFAEFFKNPVSDVVREATSSNNPSLVKSFFNNLASLDPKLIQKYINRPDATGSTPLLIALTPSAAEVDEILEILKNEGSSSKNAKLAKIVGNIEIIKFLIDNGADVNQANNGGYTPLEMAALAGNLEAVKLLVDKVSDINQEDLVFGWTPLTAAINYGLNLELIKLLIQKGADVNYANKKSGATPLIQAILQATLNGLEIIKVVQLLIENGADLNKADNEGHTPFAIAKLAEEAAKDNPFYKNHKFYTQEVMDVLEKAAATKNKK